MKKGISLLLAVLTACCLSIGAMADVIWMPDDSFLKEHEDECTTVNRTYFANGEDGTADIVVSPSDDTVLAQVKNGTKLLVSAVYENAGRTWGVVEYDTKKNKEDFLGWQTGKETGTGWVRMSGMKLIYDEQSFEEEHQKDFKDYDGSFDTLLKSTGKEIIVWTYPGSGEMADDMMSLDQSYGPLEIVSVWSDGEGRVAYYQGVRGWVCLSEPANKKLPVTEHDYNLYPAAKTGTSAAASEKATVTAQEKGDDHTGVILGVAAVCGATALLIFSMRKKKQAENPKQS